MSYFLVGKTVKIEAGLSRYRHRFGGRPRHSFRSQTNASNVHAHCLYLLDCSDPELPTVVPGVEWLPLYYPLCNDPCEFAYTVMSDDEIVVHHGGDASFLDFPDEAYPEVLPEYQVRIRPLSYQQEKTLVYCYTAKSQLSEEAVSEADSRMLEELQYPFTQIGGLQNMMQGRPEFQCPNAECEYHEFSNMHSVFGVVWNSPVPDFSLWGEYGTFTQLVFQICPKCFTIHVCNRCD